VINAGRLSGRLSSPLTAGVRATSAPRRQGLVTSFIALSLTLIGGALHAQEKPDLTSLSVDDLMNVEVTSVSRKGQKLSDTAAAVFVITQDDIRRSGATSIPEILRIVPGLDVARINGNVWAISARGFNGRFANKLLVMIDGRSVYTPLFSGVFWDVQDTLLEDVDRIEVIRGPGGTLWGANAVNGIINIITKHAIETQGTLLSAGGGAADGSSVSGRYGGSFGHNGYYRAYGKSFDRPASVGGANPSHDAWTVGRAGFRADWASRRGDNFTAQGDVYRGTEATLGLLDPANPFADRAAMSHIAGQDLQFRWTAIQSSRSDTTLQAFYDYTARSQPSLVPGRLSRHTFDIDFQNHLKLGSRNDTVWGVEYRTSNDEASGPGLELVRDSNVSSVATAFVQDEIQVARRFRVTIGTKLQYDPVSHLQLQPTLRLLFKASERQTIWAAATSAVRTPSQNELYGRTTVGAFPDGAGNVALIVVTGNSELKPERVESYEVGYRLQATPNLAFDATAFHNRMRDIGGTEAKQPFVDSSGRTIIPLIIENTVNANANGAEFFVTDAIAANWNVALGYSFFQVSAIDDEGLRSSSEIGKIATPRHQLQLRSFIQLSRQLELDSWAYYVGRIASDVPSYLRLDAQLLASGEAMGAEHLRAEPPAGASLGIRRQLFRERVGDAGPTNRERKDHVAFLRPSERAGQTDRIRLVRFPLVLFVVVAAGLSAGSARAQPVASEYQVKAAYLLNFARFVEWPADVLPASSPLDVVVVGDDSFGALRGTSANGHPIRLQHLRWDDVLTPYQIVFISASEEAHLPEILRNLGHNSVLTVSDIDRFSLRGGVIEFRMVGNRLRFDINRSAAIAAQLNISSKLLSVARAVHESSAAP